MPIPDVSREHLANALASFDRDVRDTPEWHNWEQRGNHHWAIEHNGCRYPVKQIVSMATGVPRSSFSGGPEANGYLRERGFSVVELHAATTPLDKLIERFRKQYASFSSQHYLEDERNYKLAASQRVRERLSSDQLRALIEAGQFEEAATQIKRAMQGNNLLNQWDGRPVRDAPAEQLARTFYDLLYGEGPFEARFDAWVAVLAATKPGCWPAATYFLMLSDPARHILVKPEPFRALLATLDEEIAWETRPTATRYEELRSISERLLERLRPLGAQDMIDVQSFVWLMRDDLSLVPTARLQWSELEPTYAAAERWVDEALRRDGSLFTPGRPIWTADNVTELYRRVLIEEDLSKNSFINKLQHQLEGASAEVYQFAAEVLFIHLLVIYHTGMRAATKRWQVNLVLGWSPQPVEIPPELDQALEHGFASPGIAYGTFRPFQIGFLLSFLEHWKELPSQDQQRLLDDPWSFKELLFALPIKSAYAQREAILHLAFPDTFDAILSRDHKQQIAQRLGRYVSPGITDVDMRLHQIRLALTHRLNKQVDWYEPEIAAMWRNGDTTPSKPSDGPQPFDSLGNSLRPYVSLAVHLGSEMYSPEQIVDRLGRISPPIVHLATPPDADELASELALLRLLEPLDDGTYRRWAHLSDATEELMQRYSALTLLLPVEGADDTYELPILRVPRDGEAHPASAWPGGEPLLRWYEEADLAERSGDGWHLKAEALDSVAGDTPTAHSINTFLANLRAVWDAGASGRELVDESLPVLSKETLDERVAEIQRELLIDRSTILRIYRSLIAGRNVILSGPPGTGKTHLARILPRILWRGEAPGRRELPARPEISPIAPSTTISVQREGYATDVVTATEDWGVRHVIGGIVPQIDRWRDRTRLVYGVRHGCVTRSVLQNYGGNGETLPDGSALTRRPVELDGASFRGRWLVIDEFTRAPIDAAFGSLLTTLGGQRDAQLEVPADDGSVRRVRVPRDWRLIGTLNSFDRHFLNQISEAMKRRFTFIDILPPDRKLADRERSMAIFRALLRLRDSGLAEITADQSVGSASLAGWITVRRAETPGDEQTRVQYQVSFEDDDAQQAVLSFWRLFEAIRVYRQLGTAQAEAVYATLFAGRAIGMSWSDALDAALADELADQLQVLARDEQGVLLALLQSSHAPPDFAERFKRVLGNVPPQRQRAHLALLGHDGDLSAFQAERLTDLFHLSTALPIPPDGLFAGRLGALINERGL